MRYGKAFWITLFWKQNRYHKSGIIGHTIKVTLNLIRQGRYDLVPAGILHDIGKSFSAYQDEEDILTGEYSFTNHEAFGYHIIKNWSVSDHTKDIVRWHYLLRGMSKAKEKGEYSKYRRQRKVWDKLPLGFKEDLRVFMKADDKGKKAWI